MNQAFSPDLSDEELVRLCQQRGRKDDRPFQELFRRHHNVVWQVCYNFMGNGQDAEDLSQQVFMKVYHSLPRFEGRSSLKTWVYRIAINTSQNEIRKRKRRPQVVDVDVEVSERADITSTPRPVELASQSRLQQDELAQVLARLRPVDYEVLYLKELEGRPYSEIADLLGISLSAAKMRVQRARLALQTAYRQLHEEGR